MLMMACASSARAIERSPVECIDQQRCRARYAARLAGGRAHLRGCACRRGREREVEISLSYVDEDEIHELNHEWRGIDRTTDVLSFECDSAFDEDIPADETLELGDIILAPQVIARQAPGFGNSPADECRLMLVHGMLHLLGYDHIEDDEAEVMEAREDAILRDLALERGEDPKLVHVGPITNHVHD